jgi:hypothetical protein
MGKMEKGLYTVGLETHRTADLEIGATWPEWNRGGWGPDSTLRTMNCL